MPFDGPFRGRDLDGERFTKNTNFCLDWFTERPLIHAHGTDADAGVTVVGRIKSVEIKESGGWMQAQLDQSSKYFEAIGQLIDQGKLYLSSGTIAHLAKRTKAGEITLWPLVEGSLTPTPSNLLAEVGWPVAAKHFKTAGIAVPDVKTLRVARKADGATIECPECGAMVTPADDATCPECGADLTDQMAEKHFKTLSEGIDSAGGYLVPEDHKPAPKKKKSPGAAPFGKKPVAIRKDHSDGEEVECPVCLMMVVPADDDTCPHDGTDLTDVIDGKSASRSRKRAAAKAYYSPEGSYEDLISDLNALVNPTGPFGADGDTYSYVVLTYPDFCVVCRCDDDEEDPDDRRTYWKVGYTIDADLEPILTGEQTRLESGFADAADQGAAKARAALALAPLAIHARHIKRLTAALVRRTKDLAERRGVDGRELSDANKSVLADLVTTHDAAVAGMRTLLEPSATAKAKAARDHLTRRFEIVRLQLGAAFEESTA